MKAGSEISGHVGRGPVCHRTAPAMAISLVKARDL